MPALADLVVPIFLAAAFVFIVSSILHMATPMHKNDYKGLPDEEGVLDKMRGGGSLAPGQYMFPYCASMKELDSPEMKARFERGPVGFCIVASGGMQMGKTLGTWFLYCVIVSVFVAYVASLALPKGVESMTVFRLTGATAVLAYAFSSFPDSIWKHLPWSIAMRFLVDGVLYGLATAAAFTWFWPAN